MDKANIYRNTNDFYLSSESAPTAHSHLKAALANLGGTILDFGGATGAYSRELANHGMVPVCADINYAYLTRAGSVIKVNCSTSLPFKDRAFDGAICLQVFEHLKDPESLLRELVRCGNYYCAQLR
jgi:2-polyprenyl-3-methyl-5-hydroxy-6-metoxy-1,4-benzoquinol methylase